MLVHIKEIVKQAEAGGFAVGAFNLHNLETALGIVRAAVAKQAPIIMQMSEGTLRYCGLATITAAVKALAESEGQPIPVAIHLDHGKDIETIKACITAGFSSVHIDRSDLPLVENINISKAVVEWAHQKKVWVQGEVGALLGGHGEKGELPVEVPLADPLEVKQFVDETDVDTVAAAVGTAHGIFTNEKINLDLIRQVKELVDIPLVLHGASGVNDADLQVAIKAGVRIVNIGSYIKEAFSQTLIKTACQNKSETDPRQLLTPAIEAVQAVVEERLDVLGSSGQA